MKRRAFAFLFALSLWASAQTIEDFAVTLEIKADGSLLVNERIGVYFDLPRHGIIREIPVSYRLPTGERYRLRLELLEVSEDGQNVPYKAYREGGNLVVKIGDPDVTVRGLVPYTIRYRVLRALVRYEEEVELYWNAIGTEWTMPIRRAKVEIILPSEIPPEDVHFVAYQGPYGSTAPFALAWVEGRLRGETQNLLAGQGITVAVRVPSGYIALPSFGTRVLWFLGDNVYAAIPLLVFLGMTLIWWRWGRDPKLGTVAPEYTPPPGIGPAEAGVLVDDRFDPQDFTAGILSLATKGWMKIREVAGDFQLVPQQGTKELTPYEEALREALFSGEEKDGPTFAKLKYRLYEKIPGVRAKLLMDLVDKGFYHGNPEAVRSFWRALGVGIIVLGVVLFFLFANLYLSIAVGTSGVIVAAFAPFMPRKTGKGMEALRWVRGLAEYIRRAEVERIEFAAKEQHFEELLPYAVALGMSDLWVEKFAGVLRAPPSWYEARGPWVPMTFPARLMLLHRLSQAAAAVPRTAKAGRGGWSGGSGFGGRGFSGGGMGGGGGRAW
ncbi:MAG: DUF2207 domain-containing protein [Candidatus Bipolaricaulota bacterium]|nr:DUF2207 domain-containing protein [Candidatus Bipolaricaulota bacterium]MDW8126376.1 DUF2207 domain-containing protein [Candidatus Bipolaricaulota bacterium]